MIVRRIAGHKLTRNQERREAGRPSISYVATGSGGRRNSNETIEEGEVKSDSALHPAIGADGSFGIGLGEALMTTTDGTVQPRIL